MAADRRYRGYWLASLWRSPARAAHSRPRLATLSPSTAWGDRGTAASPCSQSSEAARAFPEQSLPNLTHVRSREGRPRHDQPQAGHRLAPAAPSCSSNFTFRHGIEGRAIAHNVPIACWYPRDHLGPPQMAPFTLTLRPRNEPQAGGCANPEGCEEEEMPPLPGVILFPTDLSLLHQFFSVVLMATNGAPAGDVLTIRDLAAKIRLPAGLAPARTSPPPTLGTPVPMMLNRLALERRTRRVGIAGSQKSEPSFNG
jgi:hypothetical protein